MHSNQSTRRKFLITAAVGTATGAVAIRRPSLIFPWVEPNRFLRIGVVDWIASSLEETIAQAYLRPVAKLSGRELVIERIKPESLMVGGSGNGNSFDGFVTSPAMHKGFSPEHVFFGALPFGMERAKKLQWLLSENGQHHQNEYFKRHGFKPRLIGIGSDLFGSFSRKDLVSLDALRGVSISLSDIRRQWFSRMQMRLKNINAAYQVSAMNSGHLDVSEPLAPQFSSVMSSNLRNPGEYKYWLFPGIRTAPTLFVLWKPDLKIGASRWSARFHEGLWLKAVEKVSLSWINEETLAFTALAANHSIGTVGDEVLETLNSGAREYCRQILRLSPGADAIARDYDLFQKS